MKPIFKAKKKTAVLLAVTAAVLTALTAIAFTIAGTAAAAEDTYVTLQCESGISSQYTVEKGQTVNLTVGGLNEAFSGEPDTAQVINTGGKLNNLEITGKKAGTATIAYGTDFGKITVIRYQVTDSKNISAYTIKDGGTIRLDKPGDVKPIPVEVVSGTDNIKWHSLNETVASAGTNTGTVTAAKKGVTIIIGEFTDKWGVDRDIHILVGVGVSLDGIDDTGGEPNKPITATGAESVVDGRILDNEQTGDGDWVEIARNGDYSLIIRKDFIKCYRDQSQTDYWTWYAPEVTGDNYGEPNNFLRQALNKWFNMEINGNPDGRQTLAKDARLRQYTVQNNAYSIPGSSGKYPASLTDGFSKPAAYMTGEGNDVAFALSWSEAVSFCSVSSRYRDENFPSLQSGSIAAANYGKINNLNRIYLRSAGDSSGTMAIIFGGGSEGRGEVFQNSKAYIHPALWVHRDVFE